MKLRPYQVEAKAALFQYWDKGGENPLVKLATGLGKSLLIADTAKDILHEYSKMRILMLVHTRELVRQNFEALLKTWPNAPVGVYSAGLGRKQVGRPITYGSIQSVYNKANALGHIDLVLIDECHLVPADGEGMYLQLLSDLHDREPDIRVAGFTATDYRLGSGRLTDDGRIFDKVVYSYDIGEGVRDGWLAPLEGWAGEVEYDVTNVQRRGGEFVNSALEASVSGNEKVLEAACDELVQAGADRKSWLLFGSGIEHAFKIAEALRARGIEAATVTGETPTHERDRIFAAYKAGKLRALTGMNIFTTGFDASVIDLIALMRPTLSTGLYVQMMGRGTRTHGIDLNVLETPAQRLSAILASAKPNCRVLDYAGNIRRHGPVDAIFVRGKKPTIDTDDAEVAVAVGAVKAKKCPNCQMLLAIQARVCPSCGFEIPHDPKHDAKSDKDVSPMSKPVEPDVANVIAWQFGKHVSKYRENAAPTMKVEYLAGMAAVPEWIAFEAGQYGRQKAENWWRMHKGEWPVPATVDDAIARRHELHRPRVVTIVPNGKFLNIIDRGFDPNSAPDTTSIAKNFRPPKQAPEYEKFDRGLDFDDEIPF